MFCVAECSFGTRNRVHLLYWRDVLRVCCRVGWSGPGHLGSGIFLDVDLIGYADRALYVQSESALKGRYLSSGSGAWGRWGLILTTLVNGCELDFGIFRSGWKLKVLIVCSCLSCWFGFFILFF